MDSCDRLSSFVYHHLLLFSKSTKFLSFHKSNNNQFWHVAVICREEGGGGRDRNISYKIQPVQQGAKIVKKKSSSSHKLSNE